MKKEEDKTPENVFEFLLQGNCCRVIRCASQRIMLKKRKNTKVNVVVKGPEPIEDGKVRKGRGSVPMLKPIGLISR